MRSLILLRHSLTEGNERRLYYGSTDLPLSPAGIALAETSARERPLPPCALYVTSGLRRADETLLLLTGKAPDLVLPDLREMDFGAFEMRGYEALKSDPDYQRWISDLMGSGNLPCPGGESQAQFRVRALRGGEALLRREWQTALAVVHGGVVATLMARWFPEEPRSFYDWQPAPCRGWRVEFDGLEPRSFQVL
ncbi:MAG: histidine phosphatase family protein [Clostridia bacterium]|nr:histidine phosphatase family protein [Clostridia bacterium]